MSWPKEYSRSHMRTPGCVPEGQGRSCRSSSSSTQVERASSALCEDTHSPMGSTCQTSHAVTFPRSLWVGTCLCRFESPPAPPGQVWSQKPEHALTWVHSLRNQCNWSFQAGVCKILSLSTRLPCILGSAKILMLNHYQEMLLLGAEGLGVWIPSL